MLDLPTDARLDSSLLAEQWFSFLHKTIGEIQKAYRASGLSQKAIAQRLGTGSAAISRRLAGQQNMTMRTMHDLARAMDCRLEIAVRPLKELKPTNRGTILRQNKADLVIKKDATGSLRGNIYKISADAR